jgi:hypothetical protein
MDRDVLQEHLAECQRRVLVGQKHVLRQREIIAELGAHGDDATFPHALLRQFQVMLALQIAEHDRLRRELGVPC